MRENRAEQRSARQGSVLQKTLREVIARDLKGMGHYLRRTLSMEGINWHERKFAPTSEEIETYNRYVSMMHRIQNTLEDWVDRQSARLGKESTFTFKGQVMTQYWKFQQTFFASLQASQRVRQLLPEIKEKLDDGNKVAVQLSTTGQAYQERGYSPTLKGMLISFLNRPSSPIYRRRPIGTGDVTYYKEDGKNVLYSDRMLAEKNNLITIINDMPDLPLSPIDMLHSSVRGWGYNSHELTGRNEMNVESENGQYRQIAIDKDSEKMERLFRESTDLNFVVIGDAGGEGRNLQTLREDSPIWHYDIESGWNPIQVVQKFGRSHRTGAAHKPEYVLVYSDSPASLRQVSGVRAKLTEMGALAAGQASQRLSLLASQTLEEQDTNEDSTDVDRANYIFGRFGKQAIANLIRNWYRAYQMGDNTVEMKMQMLGLRFAEDGKGGLKDYPKPEQFISHLYQVPYQEQGLLAQEFFDVLDGHLALAADQGTLDTGVAQVKTHRAQVSARQQLTVHEDSGTPTEVVQVTGSTPRPRFSWNVVESVRGKQPGFEGLAGAFSRYARNTKSGRIYAFFHTGLAGDIFGETRYKQFGTRGAPRYVSMSANDFASGNWETLFGSGEEAIREPEARAAQLDLVKQAWETEDQQRETRQPLSLTMITGVLMPVWDKIDLKVRDLNMANTDDVIAAVKMSGFRSVEEMMNAIQMRQVTLSDGSSLQGRIVPAAFLEALFERFNINIDATPFKDIETLPVADEAAKGLEDVDTSDINVETEPYEMPELPEITEEEPTTPETEIIGEEGFNRELHLSELGIEPYDWDLWDPDQQRARLEDVYGELLLAEADGESEITEAQRNAYRALSDEINANELNDYKRQSPNRDWNHAFPKTEQQRQQVQESYASKIRRILGLNKTPELSKTVADLNAGKYFSLQGQTLNSAAEAAVIAQFIRNPLVESTLILLRKAGKIIGAKWLSLGKTDTTTPDSYANVEKMLAGTKADDFIRVHNHPSKIAKFGENDKTTALSWRERFGTKHAAEVIINEGTYATSQFGKKTEFVDDLPLDLTKGLPDAPFIGAFMKTPSGWTTFILTDDTGKMVGTVEMQGFTKLKQAQMLGALNRFMNDTEGATRMHIHVGQGYNTDGANVLRDLLDKYPQFRSAWLDGQPMERRQVLGEDLPTIEVSPEAEGVLRDYAAEADRVAPGSYFVPHGKITTSNTVNPEKVGIFSRLRGLFDPAVVMKARLDGFVGPRAKLNLERTRREYMSGYRNLEMMGSVGAEIREVSEHLLRLQEQGTARDLAALETHRKATIDLAKQRAKGQKGAAREAVYSEISEQVYRFMEENTPIEDAEVAKIAEGWKEAWRKILKAHDVYMMELRERVEALGEQLLIYSASGAAPKPWMPILPGHTWLDDRKMFLRESDNTFLTLEEAVDQTDKLYMPHIYPRSHWTELIKQVETGVLDALIEAEKDPTITEVPGFIIYDTDSGRIYEFTRTGETFDSKQAAIAGARAFWNASYTIAQQQTAASESDILGRFGNLELARETNDKLYSRDVMTLLDHSALFWRRFAEISVWGQVDPATGKHPRLQQYLSRLEQTTLDADEHALKVVVDTLTSHEMFEKLPSFVEGEEGAYHILRNWKHPVRDPKYWENKPPPPPDHPVDIERMMRENPEGFTPEVMESLERIGLIEKKADGEWTIKGQTKAAKDTTFVKTMTPFFQTRQLREQTLMKIVQGLGHWNQLEPIDSQSNAFWKLLNGITTMFSLGFGNAAQNIAEVPWLASMSGSKPLAIGLRRFATDPEFRQMLPRFGATLNKARDYLAEGELQNRYMSMIGFTATEKWSRLMGTAVGWEAARDAIQAHITNPNKNSLVRLQELNISPGAVEQYSEALNTGDAPALDDLVKEAEQRVLKGTMMLGGLRPPDAPDPSNPFVDLIGDEMAKSARYVSTRIFKGYNTLSMPNFLTKKHPMIRTFFKFKAWGAQMHQFVWEQFRHAIRQAKQGNLRPAMRLAIGAGFMMGSAAVMTSVFNALRGRERDEDRNRILEALAQSQAAGVASTIIEIMQISEGNPYRASQMISSFFSAPAIGIGSHILGEAAAGDFGDAAKEFGLRFPFVREIPRIQQLR